MRILIWIKSMRRSIKLKVFYLTRWIIGYFILGRDCSRCKYRKFDWAYFYSYYTCENTNECLKSVTYKHFERKGEK